MRLITRADYDGIVCGVILSANMEIDSYKFVEPKYMQDGEVDVFEDDIIANLPYHPNCAYWFDHHISNQIETAFEGDWELAPSAAGVIYKYFGGAKKMPRYKELIADTDKIDSAQLTMEDVKNPEGNVLLSFTVFPKEEDYYYHLLLISWLREKPIKEIMELPEVKKRTDAVLEELRTAKEHITKHSRQDENVIVTDILKFKGRFHDGNRFLIYTLFPEANISMKIADFPEREGYMKVSVGKSIFVKTSNINVGELMAKYGGGGHKGAGSCRFPKSEADKNIPEILAALKEK